jgi:aryl-alcohol dehydrogenase-like predicted oxidoreductase
LANGRVLQQAPLQAAARERGVGADALALAALLAQPFVTLVLSGAATVEQVRQNAAALQIDDAPWLELAEPPEQYWAIRSRLPWN